MLMRRHLSFTVAVLIAAIVSVGALASAAFATPATTTSTTSTTTTSTGTTTSGTTPSSKPPTSKPPASTTPTTPTGAPANAAVHLYLADAFYVNKDAVSVPGRTVQVQGFVRPYVPDQWVDVEAFVGTKRFKTDRLRIKPDKTIGAFTETLKAPAAGIVRVKIVHAKTPQMVGFFAQRAWASLNPSAGVGARGLLVTLAQQRLAALHIYMPQSGVFDLQTQLALDAYHRLLGWGEGDMSLDARTMAALLDGLGTFHVRYPGNGTHAEGDLSDQLLALTNGSKVYEIFPISSGKPSTPTVLGNYRVYYRVPGYLPDGMYYSSFFYSGYAIHGYDPAPDYPASHGCMRLPISDAIHVFDWLNYGDWVDVYYT
jgi:hypothetical protein